MDFSPNKKPIGVIKEGAFGGTYFREFVLVLMESGTERHGKNLISWKISIKSIVVQIIVMSVSINTVLNAERR